MARGDGSLLTNAKTERQRFEAWYRKAQGWAEDKELPVNQNGYKSKICQAAWAGWNARDKAG